MAELKWALGTLRPGGAAIGECHVDDAGAACAGIANLKDAGRRCPSGPGSRSIVMGGEPPCHQHHLPSGLHCIGAVCWHDERADTGLDEHGHSGAGGAAAQRLRHRGPAGSPHHPRHQGCALPAGHPAAVQRHGYGGPANLLGGSWPCHECALRLSLQTLPSCISETDKTNQSMNSDHRPLPAMAHLCRQHSPLPSTDTTHSLLTPPCLLQNHNHPPAACKHASHPPWWVMALS
ncbi:hypothetical protein HaLaN_06218, partial [Haematococcus lacustris]